jgi:murein L,D-transpeptidase YafK
MFTAGAMFLPGIRRRMRSYSAAIAAIALSFTLAACDERSGSSGNNRHWVQIPPQTMSLMSEKNMSKFDPILIRSYKKESELEVWKRGKNGQYALLKSYPMCRWSGQLGPKVREGDRQAPEGFYTITPAQMNPNSSFYLSYNMGFPNAFDRAYGRTGSHLMVHGACSSRGCYSMTDEQIAEIYALVREAHSGGQTSVQMQAFPFRMTAENLARHRSDPHMPFWRNLKEGADHFEVTKQEPQVAVCGKRYVFNVAPDGSGRFDAVSSCPPLKMDEDLAQAVAQKVRADQAQVAELVAKGTPAVKLVYDDGDQHHSFKQVMFAQQGVGDSVISPVVEQRSRVVDVSRPDALASGPKEVALDDAGKPKVKPVIVAATRPVEAPAVTALPRTSGPVAASLAPVVAAPVQGEAPSVERSLAQRVFTPLGNPFSGFLGGSEAAQKAVEIETPSEPLPSLAPLPPRRQAEGRPARDRVSATSPVIRGAYAILPAGSTGFSPSH